jgi:hypothetical protein
MQKGDDEQFHCEAEPPIVLSEAGLWPERQRADARSRSRVVAARCVGRGRALANGTRGERNARTKIDRIRVTHLEIATRMPAIFPANPNVYSTIGAIRTWRRA